MISTNWTPQSLPSTNWKKNSSIPTGITAGDVVVTAGSLTIYATGYTVLNLNFIENIPSTNWSEP